VTEAELRIRRQGRNLRKLLINDGKLCITRFTDVTKPLYLDDSYLQECAAIVASVKEGKYVTLNQTVFYPKGGGQPWDTGRIVKGDEAFEVVYVGKFSGKISHEVDHAGLAPGDPVHCILNWNRRYNLMRAHTAAHVFASLLCRETGAFITGNQLAEDKVRFDFSLEQYDRTILEEFIDKANKLLREDIEVKWYELPTAEALKIEGVVKMAKAFPPDIPKLRIVDIVNVDKQADGGTHVKNLKEVGQIRLLKTVNKGKNNRRVYFELV
jgi:Ser-tRNA(Ala) deacylase AlaX